MLTVNELTIKVNAPARFFQPHRSRMPPANYSTCRLQDNRRQGAIEGTRKGA
jgi:hypothetical protein